MSQCLHHPHSLHTLFTNNFYILFSAFASTASQPTVALHIFSNLHIYFRPYYPSNLNQQLST